jgi:hypothetical protein
MNAPNLSPELITRLTVEWQAETPGSATGPSLRPETDQRLE